MKPLLGMFQFAFACPHGQLSRPFTIKDVPGLLGLCTRAGVFVGRDALSKVKWC